MDWSQSRRAEKEKYGVEAITVGWHELVQSLAETLPQNVEVGSRADLITGGVGRRRREGLSSADECSSR